MKKFFTAPASFRSSWTLAIALVALTAPFVTQAADPKSAPAAAPSTPGERVDVEEIKEKYWARGQEAEIGVVQNRLYSKANKFQLGTYLGTTMSDAFLTIRTGGFSFGYNFSEYLALSAVAWKSYTTDSAAYKTFQEVKEGRVNDNPHKAYFGIEGTGSLLYGKLSLVGAKIIYFDMHGMIGAGMTQTRNGTYVTPSIGVGQRIYLSQHLSLRLDYRAMVFHEQIKERTVTARLGEVVGTRNNVSHNIALGVNFLFGGPDK